MTLVTYRTSFFQPPPYPVLPLNDYCQQLLDNEYSNMEWIEWCTREPRRAYFDLEIHGPAYEHLLQQDPTCFDSLCSTIRDLVENTLLCLCGGQTVATIADASSEQYIVQGDVEPHSIISMHFT